MPRERVDRGVPDRTDRYEPALLNPSLLGGWSEISPETTETEIITVTRERSVIKDLNVHGSMIFVAPAFFPIIFRSGLFEFRALTDQRMKIEARKREHRVRTPESGRSLERSRCRAPTWANPRINSGSRV